MLAVWLAGGARACAGGTAFAEDVAVRAPLMPIWWVLALVVLMFSYSGWSAAVYVAEEVRDPSRNVPLALALGTLTVVIVYVALNVLYLFALPVDQLAALPGGRLMDTVAERLFGFAAGDVIALFPTASLA